MEARIYKPKRLQNGKRITGRLYRARIKLAGDSKVRDIALQVSDKQVAQQKLNKLVQELEHESAGLIPAKRGTGSGAKSVARSGFGIRQRVDRPGAVGRPPAPCGQTVAAAGAGMRLDEIG